MDTITVRFTEQQIHLLERLATDWTTSVEDVVHRVLVDELSPLDLPVPVGATADVR